jgi:uncharacterized membrane protein
MQMRSAEESQASAMGQDAQPPTAREANNPLPPSDERPGSRADADAATDQDTTIFPPPDDPFATSSVTETSHRAQGAASPGPAAPAQGYVSRQLPAHPTPHSEVATTLTFTPNTAAGVSYLFLWVSGVLIFFNERRNRYVRFHALQSILFGTVATVFGVVGIVAAVLLMDLGSAWHASILSAVGLICALLIPFTIVVVWWWLLVAAWTGHEFALPILGQYAKQYAAPEEPSFPAPHA